MFDAITLDLPCPECGSKTTKTIGWIKAHNHFRCRCGVRVDLDKRQLVSELRKAESGLDSLRRQLGR